MIQKILIAYDGSDPARRAFDMALDVAKHYAAPLLVLSVARPQEPAADVETEAMLEYATEHFQKDFGKFRKAAQAAGVSLTTKVAVGHVPEQIIHYAETEKVDMIVMGHRGKNLIQRWLLGSVSKRVMSYAHCSVLIVR